jgi:hypothetical protein
LSVQPAPDRRSHPRYLCWVEALYVAEENAPQPARLLDLSASGARIALLKSLPAGADLRLTLPRGDRTPVVLSGVVNRINRTREGWEAGCTFNPPLSEEHIHSLLQAIEVG